MSTIIHKYRITACTLLEKTTKEIYDYCFGFSEEDFSFEDWLDRLGADTKNSGRMDFAEFISIISENYTSKGLAFFDLVFRLYHDEFNHLQQSNSSGHVIHLTSAEALLWYHIFVDLSVDGFQKFPLRELKIEIAQIEDGITAFPKVDDRIFWGYQYREFLTRLLATLPDSDPFHFPVSEWLENNGQNSSNGLAVNNEIVWGVKEENRLVVEDVQTLQNSSSEWWSKVLQETLNHKIQHNGENWIHTLHDYPFEVVTVKVLLHNSWFPHIENLVKNKNEFDSTAYFIE